ncbi:MAG: Crp/Fnr family transcriptional regulator [Myxococcota bacterium]
MIWRHGIHLNPGASPWHDITRASIASFLRVRVSRVKVRVRVDVSENRPSQDERSRRERHLSRWREAADRGRLGPPLEAPDRSLLLKEMDPANHVLLVTEGCFEVIAQWSGGTSRVLRVLPAPTFAGISEVLSDVPLYLGGVRSVGRVLYYMLTPSRLKQLLAAELELSIEALADQCAANDVTAIAALFPLAESEARLATILCTYAEVVGVRRPDGWVELPFKRSQEDLAGIVGVSSRTITRAIANFREQGLLKKQRGRFIVRVDGLWHLGEELGLRARPLLEAWRTS